MSYRLWNALQRRKGRDTRNTQNWYCSSHSLLSLWIWGLSHESKIMFVLERDELEYKDFNIQIWSWRAVDPTQLRETLHPHNMTHGPWAQVGTVDTYWNTTDLDRKNTTIAQRKTWISEERWRVRVKLFESCKVCRPAQIFRPVSHRS